MGSCRLKKKTDNIRGSNMKNWATSVVKAKNNYETTHEQLMQDCGVLLETPYYFFMGEKHVN